MATLYPARYSSPPRDSSPSKDRPSPGHSPGHGPRRGPVTNANRTGVLAAVPAAISKEEEANQGQLPPTQQGKSNSEPPGHSTAIMDAATRKLLSSAVAEALGIAMICFFGCMGTLSGPLGQVLTHMQVALTFGLVVMIAIACFAHVSGAHLNPSVTLLALIMKMVDVKTAVVYLFSQCFGATLGYGLLKVVTPDTLLYWAAAASPANITLPGPCCTVPHPGLSAAQAVLAELIGTSALLMLCCSVWDARNANNTDGIPLKFGLLIAGLALCLGPYTGCSLNPARSLGPAIWEGTWKYHWVYWVGPLSSAVLLGYGWPLLFAHVPEAPVKDNADVPLTLVSTDGKRHSRLANDDDANDGKAGY